MEESIYQFVANGLGPGTILTVVLMLAIGKLVPGATHNEMREDRDFYRDRFLETTQMLSAVLGNVEVQDGTGTEVQDGTGTEEESS